MDIGGGMNKFESVNIRKVGNGYIITPSLNQNMSLSDLDTYVFNSVNDLQDWLKEHFENDL